MPFVQHFLVVINLDGSVAKEHLSFFEYKSKCKSQGIKNIVCFTITFYKDFYKLFCNHKNLIEDINY